MFLLRLTGDMFIRLRADTTTYFRSDAWQDQLAWSCHALVSMISAADLHIEIRVLEVAWFLGYQA